MALPLLHVNRCDHFLYKQFSRYGVRFRIGPGFTNGEQVVTVLRYVPDSRANTRMYNVSEVRTFDIYIYM